VSAALAPRPRAGRGLAGRLGVAGATLAVVAVAWATALGDATGRLAGAGELLARAWRFLGAVAGTGTDADAWRDPSAWWDITRLTAETAAIAVAATALGLAAALLTLPFAARSLALDPAAGPAPLSRLLLVSSRAVHAVLRGTPELVWAFLVVFLLRPGPFAAVVALALHEAGVLGRLAREVVDDLPPPPGRALRSLGAGRVTVAAYAVLPRGLPQLTTFALHRAEVVLRATVVVGFVTAAGLGQRLRLDVSFFRWTDLALVLLAYVLLAWLGEAVAGRLRARLR
jgi:phosphonate transport system permease protein